MTTATNQDGGAMDPKVARVLIRYREEVAQATERACRDLRAAGVQDVDGRILRREDPIA